MATTSKERSTIRLTALKRRDEIVDAAMHEFALGGFDGAAAAVIALRALPARQAMLTVAPAMDLPGAWS
jgi:hypothetical protein